MSPHSLLHRRQVLGLLALVTIVALVLASNLYGVAAPVEAMPQRVAEGLDGNLLYDNGPLITHYGTGPGGADESVVQNLSLGLTTNGANVRSPTFRIADDFEVTAPSGWQVERVVFYAYQTGSGTESTFSGVNYRIWDGPPNDPASVILYGDTTINRLAYTDWANAYRRSEDKPGNTDRPVMYIHGAAEVHLPAGRYWLDWQLSGRLSSGPWQPPVTILGETTTGNALHWTGTAWGDLVDESILAVQGAPFQLWGTAGAEPPTPTPTGTATPTHTPTVTPTGAATSPPTATATPTSIPAATHTPTPTATLPPTAGSVYLPLVLKQGPVGTPTPTATATTQPGRWVTNGPYGGSVSALAMSVSNPDILYAAMGGAGLFKTANGGDVWSQVASPPEQIQRIYVAPNNPGVVYAGTANGIYKSIDGGATWTHKGLAGMFVRAIAIHSSDPQVIYVGARSGTSTGGVFKSTDAGETWQQKLAEADLRVNALWIDATIPGRIYLGVGREPVGSVAQGLRISSDGGDSWTSHKVTTLSGEAVTVLAMTPMGYTPPTLYAAAELQAVYKSTDGGLTWTRAWQTDSVHSAMSLAVDAQTPQIVYAGGGGIRSLPATPTPDWYPFDLGSKSRFWRSADDGATWNRRDAGLPGDFVASIVIDPRDGRLYVGLRSAGVYRSTDGGGSWQFASQGITATNVQGLAADPGGSGRVIAAIEGPSHPMAVTAGAGTPWLYLIGDDKPTNVGAVAVDPANPSTWYTGDGLVGNWQWVYTFRSTDGGNTWTANQLFYKTDGPVGQVVYHRVFALAVDPGNASTVLAAVAEQRTAYGGVYKSSNAGASWSRTLPDWATALAFDPTSPGWVYAGAVRYGKVFRSTDSGTTWTQIGGSTLEALRVYDIAVAPNGHVYVATNGGLQKWDGTTWSAVTGLPPVPAIALAIDTSTNPGAVYVGTTTHGVCVSRDGGGTWAAFNEGLGNLYVTELAISNGPTRTLYAGTAYGGVWSIDISSATE